MKDLTLPIFPNNILYLTIVNKCFCQFIPKFIPSNSLKAYL
ncbi:Uncharacterised protein [uncultured archaeon]|nr:Uncharacterised protein [uncultured archaeon]